MKFRRSLTSFFCFTLVVLLTACGQAGEGGLKQGEPPVARNNNAACPPSINSADANAVVATIDGQNITEGEIADIIKSRMRRVEQDIYDIKSEALENLIDQKLLENTAKEKKINVGKLLKDEVYAKIQEVTDKDAQDFYNENKMRFGKQAFEDIKDRIKSQMANFMKQQAKADYLDELRQKHKISIAIEPPRVAEVKVAANDPTIGDNNAPVQIVEFSEFQCPFCLRTRPTIEKLLKDYKGKIQYVFRDFPLGFHQYAKSAANAAHCAGEQGKYWEFNKDLFENQKDLSKSDFISKLATKHGLNKQKFDECQSSNRYFADIDADQKEGSEMGVSGTPAFFINGIFLSGAQPYEKFKAIIDAELARKK